MSANDDGWIVLPAALSWYEFIGLGVVVPGARVRLTSGEELLVGDINEQGGVCDDCMHESLDRYSDRAIVVGYLPPR